MRQRILTVCQSGGIALLALAGALMVGCAANAPAGDSSPSTPPPSTSPPSGADDREARRLFASIYNPSTYNSALIDEPLQGSMQTLPTSGLSLGAPERDGGLLPPLEFSGHDDAQPPVAAMPGSGFVAQEVHGFARTMPASILRLVDADIGVLLGHAGDNHYTAGLGWAPISGRGYRVKLSVLRQQLLGESVDGQWLASVQGKARSLPLLGGLNLRGELALSKHDTPDMPNDEAVGARIRLAKPGANGLGYGLTLSRFGKAFRPVGSRVNAGRRRAAADLHYKLRPNLRITADTSVTEYDSGGTRRRYEVRTAMALAGFVVDPVKVRLETSVLRALDGVGRVNRQVEHWKLSLAEDTLTGWHLSLALSNTDIEFPRAGNTLIKRSFQLESRKGLRLGSYAASFGPALSLHTNSEGRVQRRINAGIVLDIDSALHAVNLSMGYQSLTGVEALQRTETVNLDLSYKLNFDV